MPHGVSGQGIVKRLGMANYELFPVVIIVGAVCAMAGSFSIYSLFKKTDVVLFKRSNPHPWEKVNPSQQQKFLKLNQEYKPIPALEKLKQEMGER
ncbi:normal mucosa of esophagus-specific gene 1 protein-like [Apostichopus japonicus]|uniref:normal mucosa of esophagus-specific gene 1 protein-like n=1 Tax=Stichopus japonicus TaxID=307972 RepID=UPI003AB2807B